MATEGVTGRTQDWFDEQYAEFVATDPDEGWERQYCMAKIPHQPDDYDGPQRFCSIGRDRLYSLGSNWRCKYHGGMGHGNPENMEHGLVTNMKHGMHALRENLVDDFDDKDAALYDWIVKSFSENYDIDIENDPNAAYDLHRYAAEAVRAERGRGFLLEEGEVHETEVVSDEGNVVIDENGEIVTDKSEHYLAKMLDRQDSKLTKLAKTLGISRKDRLNRDQTDDAVEAITKGFSELGSAFLNRDEKEYDPDEQPWNDNESDS